MVTALKHVKSLALNKLSVSTFTQKRPEIIALIENDELIISTYYKILENT